MDKIIKALSLATIICLAISFVGTGEWFNIILIIVNGIILAVI